MIGAGGDPICRASQPTDLSLQSLYFQSLMRSTSSKSSVITNFE
jgi:hypothetical protein